MERPDLDLDRPEPDPPVQGLAPGSPPDDARLPRFQREAGRDPLPSAELDIEPGWELA